MHHVELVAQSCKLAACLEGIPRVFSKIGTQFQQIKRSIFCSWDIIDNLLNVINWL